MFSDLIIEITLNLTDATEITCKLFARLPVPTAKLRGKWKYLSLPRNFFHPFHPKPELLQRRMWLWKKYNGPNGLPRNEKSGRRGMATSGIGTGRKIKRLTKHEWPGRNLTVLLYQVCFILYIHVLVLQRFYSYFYGYCISPCASARLFLTIVCSFALY